MQVKYEDALYEAELYIDWELVDSLKDLKNPTLKRQVHVVFPSRYHFYETPWEKEDRFYVQISLDGKWFSSRGMFINKTRTIVLKSNFEEI